MDAEHAPLFDAVGPLLLPEAGGVGGEGLRQLALRQELVNEPAHHGVLAGADEVEILALDLVHHGVHVRLAHDVAVDHEGGDAVGEALVDHEVPGVGQGGLVEPGHVPQQVVEAVSGHTARRVHVDAVQALHDLRMVGDLKVRHNGLTEPLHLHVGAVVGADGHGGVNDIGDHQQQPVELRLQLPLPGLQLRQTLGVGLYLGLHRLGLLQLGGVLLGLPHEHPHLLAEGVPLGPELAGLGDGGPVLAVQGQDLVHHGQLLVLELLFDVFLHNVRVLPDEFDIQHRSSCGMFHVKHAVFVYLVVILFLCEQRKRIKKKNFRKSVGEEIINRQRDQSERRPGPAGPAAGRRTL